MAVDSTRVPVLFFLACTAAGQTKDLLAVYGAIYIKNTGSDPVWINFTSAPPGAASDGDGRTQIPSGAALNLDDIAIRYVSGICAAAKTADLQIVCTKRPGTSGTGEA